MKIKNYLSLIAGSDGDSCPLSVRVENTLGCVI
jgi:hypothetical protein